MSDQYPDSVLYPTGLFPLDGAGEPQPVDVTPRNLALLTSQYDAATKLRAYLSSFLTQMQELEQSAFELWRNRWLDNAEGAQLDELGAMVGWPRAGLTDGPYRQMIRVKIFLNSSKATPPHIIEAVRLVTEGTEIHYWEAYPCKVFVYSNGTWPPGFETLMQGLMPAGVKFAGWGDGLLLTEGGDTLTTEDGDAFLVTETF